MPKKTTNLCSNILTVTGPRKTLQKFLQKAKFDGKPFSFMGLYPPPEGWNYDWCVEHWGVKWDLELTDSDDLEIFDTDDEFGMEVKFDTPWAPPEEAFIKISKDFPTLTFALDFEEPKTCLEGFTVFKAGKVVKISEKEEKVVKTSEKEEEDVSDEDAEDPEPDVSPASMKILLSSQEFVSEMTGAILKEKEIVQDEKKHKPNLKKGGTMNEETLEPGTEITIDPVTGEKIYYSKNEKEKKRREVAKELQPWLK